MIFGGANRLTTSWAVALDQYAHSVRISFALASIARFSAGSTPTTFIPASLNLDSRHPSLLAISSTHSPFLARDAASTVQAHSTQCSWNVLVVELTYK